MSMVVVLRKYFPFILLFLIGFLIYFNSLSNGFVWDDEEQIVNNNVIRDLKNIPIMFSSGAFNSGGTGKLLGIYFKPLMTFTFAIIYSLFKLNTFYYHLVSVIIFIINSCLVYILLMKFFDKNKSLLLSLLFLVHPLYSEVALYMANMQDLLYFFFGMLGLLFYSYYGSVLFFLLSLLSKETGIVFIAISVIYTYLFAKNKIKLVIVYGVVAVLIYALIRFYIAGIYFSTHEIVPIAQLSLIERVKNIPHMLYYYFSNYIWPTNLTINQNWIVK